MLKILKRFILKTTARRKLYAAIESFIAYQQNSPSHSHNSATNE